MPELEEIASRHDDALLDLYRERFTCQVEATTTAAAIGRWR